MSGAVDKRAMSVRCFPCTGTLQFAEHVLNPFSPLQRFLPSWGGQAAGQLAVAV